jgi:hypothetical protein
MLNGQPLFFFAFRLDTCFHYVYKCRLLIAIPLHKMSLLEVNCLDRRYEEEFIHETIATGPSRKKEIARTRSSPDPETKAARKDQIRSDPS